MKKDNQDINEKFVCSVCGAALTSETMYEFEGQVFCKECFDTRTTVCSGCGRRISNYDSITFDGHILCRDCLNEQTSVCEECGGRMWNDDVCGDSDTVLCSHCEEYHYTNCEECGRLIHRDNANYDDDYAYCYSCYEKLEEKPIHCYNYKPEPIFYGSGDLFMGVELEIDKGGNYDENAAKLLDIANCHDEHMYCKHDGSIDYGFEMVSHPMSLDYHMNDMNWPDVFNKAVSLGYRSHQTSTCGLHVHINRNAFGQSHEMQEEVIARIVHFTELHWNELLKLTRRTEENINRWASRYGISTTAKDTYKNAKDKHKGRYVAINLENHSTIEFRVFRGTLRYNTFIATLQLVDEICRLAIKRSDKEIESMSWSDFVIGIDSDKPELIEYLKLKRLYVNELQTETEEF